MRAIAVLAVVLFHIDELWISAGFIGVDIFFTISGFLITGILLRSQVDGGFSLATFYRNRIRRIVPVLTLVIFCTLVVGQLVLLPRDMVRLAESAMASQLFVANIFFTYYQDTSYFAPDARMLPLLHLWSLGAEEQFYLLWPLLLIAGSRYLNTRTLVFWIALATLGSFVFGQYYYWVNPMFSYYMLPSRAGQLLAGALCFFALARLSRLSSAGAAGLALAGLVLIGLSLLLLSPGAPYPGYNAIAVTLGTVMVIYAGATTNPVSSILSVRPIVKIGLLSYSIYLWHWPILAFSRYLYGPPTLTMQLLILVLIFALAWLSFTAVETPFRKIARAFRVVLVRYLVIPTVFFAGVFAYIISSNGVGIYDYVDGYRSDLKKAMQVGRKAPRANYVCQPRAVNPELFEADRCVTGNPSETNILLWGDSNAAHYVGAFKELGSAYNLDIRNIALGACSPILDNPGAFTTSRVRAKCEEFIALLKQNATRFDQHIISGNWSWYLEKHGAAFEQALARTVTELQQSGVRVLLLGRIPSLPRFDRHCEAKALKVSNLNCGQHKQVADDDIEKVNAIIENIAMATGAEYLDFNALLCSEGVCYGVVKGSELYFDFQHLSEAGSTKLGQLATESGFRSDLFKSLGSAGAVKAD